jgi:2-polyprenyl-6-methoxyphenol hydroxylase-like FAD-dependent oxidoreductase
MRASHSTHHDVVIVGSRCAGAAAAMLLARAGHDVAVVDRSRFPSDTVSTHGLVRGGVVQLARWGLLDNVLASGAPAVREVTFRRDDTEITRRVKDRAGVDLLVAPRRHVLDLLLVEAAQAAGAQVRTGVTATGLRRGASNRVVGVDARTADGQPIELTATWVVGADGVRSRMAGWVGAQVLDSFTAPTATFYLYVADVTWPAYEFHVGRDALAGVFPTHGGDGCVWLCRPTARLGPLRSAGADRTAALVAQLDAVSPTLAARVRAGRITSVVRGAVGLPNHVREPFGSGWALVGDAGYHRDPMTGHGITDAFRDAELLATAIDASLRDPADEQEAMSAYGRRRLAALQETFDLTRAMTSFPHPDRFVELQIQLSEALEREAALLAALPAPAGAAVTAA